MKNLIRPRAADAAPASAGVASAAVRRLLCAAVLLAYAACVLYITLLSRTPSLTRSFSMALFESWRRYLAGDRSTGKEALENIVLFIPVGFLSATLWFSLRKFGKQAAVRTLLTGLAFSLAIEAMQYYSGRGWFHVDDLFHNTLGTALGYLGFLLAVLLLAGKKQAGRVILFGVLPALMLLSGLLGCRLMRDMVAMTNLHADQFWFSIDDAGADRFSGRCRIYDRPTPSYRLFLVNGSEKQEAKVTRQGDAYIAKAYHTDGKYELQVRFDGYVTLPTGVYLNRGKVEYLAEDVREPIGADGGKLLSNAVLKAYAEKWDCYVYQSGTELIWLIGPDVAPETELVCHIQTNEPERLPAHRLQYGFDNIGCAASQAEETLGGYRLCVRSIPTEYPVSSIIVGLGTGDGVVWSSTFRP